jgi:hypothetical protein
MMANLVGCWTLSACRRIPDAGEISYPFGENPLGLLIYMPDKRMAVQIAAADRSAIGGAGAQEQRAKAFSTYLAYFGTYEVEADRVIHHVETSLFPDWSGSAQVRGLSLAGDTLTLSRAMDGVRVELVWIRAASDRDAWAEAGKAFFDYMKL